MDVPTGPFDVVVLGASAGAHAAVITLLRGLPPDFSLPIVLMQHLPPDSTGTVAMYQCGAPFAVAWLSADSALAPRTVLVCPPRRFVELLPDGTFVLAPNETGAVEKPIDRLFASVARSFGPRAIGVILTGRGSDGALGARQLHLTGGRVLVQHEASAESPDMPRAAITAGAADLVVPLADLGQVLGELVAGTPRPQARSELAAIHRAFGAQSEVAARAREVDWGLTPLGPVISWPEHLRLLVRAVLDSPVMMAIWLGPELIQVYNDAWRSLLGARQHPQALGGPARETWPELWPQLGPLVEGVLTRGDAAFAEDVRIAIDRDGVSEEVFVSFAFSPIRDSSGMTVGVQQTGWNVTTNVVAERRMRVLRELATQVAGASSPHQACERAAQALASDPADIPFALLYLLDDGRQQATLAAVTGAAAGSAVAPHVILLRHEGAAWPLQRVLSDEAHPGGLRLSDLAERFSPPAPAARRPARHAPAPHGVPPATPFRGERGASRRAGRRVERAPPV